VNVARPSAASMAPALIAIISHISPNAPVRLRCRETNTSIDGVEWWDVAHSLMVKHGMPQRSIIPRLVREAKMVPRPGALELLKRLEDLNVPVLIVSAGLSDVIEEFLRQHGALSENVTVCSNRLNYQADSTPKSVSPEPPITSFTKEYAYSSASAFFAEHAKRRAILQLGDSLTDVDPCAQPHAPNRGTTPHTASSRDPLRARRASASLPPRRSRRSRPQGTTRAVRPPALRRLRQRTPRPHQASRDL
jgi:phosphoglycolate phosphatase-like HAD superfamily hydrolase